MSARMQDASVAVKRSASYLSLLVFLMGLAASAIFVGASYRRLASYTWVDAAATIEFSEVVEGDLQKEESPFHTTIRFRYSFGGRSYVAEQTENYGDYRESQTKADRFPVGKLVPCYVNPKNPQEAVLQRPPIWIFLFPLAFCAIGAAGLLFIRLRRPRREKPEAWKEFISESTAAKSSRMILPPLYVFFSIFSLGGVSGLYVCCLKPALRTVSAFPWNARPCVIIASRVKTVGDSEGDLTSSPDILYSYSFGDRQYKSNRYDFWGESSEIWAEIEAIVARFPPGSSCICYVNPSDPADAVLERGFSWNIFYGLVPLLFLSIGLAGLFLLIPLMRKSERLRRAVL